jgi:polar amino acid transport system permease protein
MALPDDEVTAEPPPPGGAPSGDRARAPDEIRAVPVRHPGRWVAAVIVLVVAVSLIHSAASNPNFGWGQVGHYMFDFRITHGVLVTIELTVAAQAMGIVLGVILAVMRLSPNPLVAGGSWLYIWFFRGTPVLVQLLFWYNIAALYHTFALGVPFGPAFVHIDANSLVTPFLTVVFALGLNEGAYMSEIVRAGIISVEEGQTEAALSLGMSRLQAMRRIVLPQAMRVIIPPTGNETISMLKTTSLAYVVAGTDVTSAASNIYSANFETIQLLIVASIWYLAITSVLYVGQYYLERHYARGASRELPPTPLQKLKRGVFSFGHDPIAAGAFGHHKEGGIRL